MLAFAPVALVTGLLGGLVRLGWDLPGIGLAELHGGLMISGLFGTVIGLERAVALGHPAAYGAPALAAAGTVGLLTGAAGLGTLLYVGAAAVLAGASADILRRQPAVFTATMLAGAAAWLVGNLLWLAGFPIFDLAGWWLAFLVLTIAGERLELSRLLAPKRGSLPLFGVAVGLILVGAGLGLVEQPAVFGIGLLVASLWLARHDIARRSIRSHGAPRFFASCMLSGYAWLAIAGVLLLLAPPKAASFGYDLALHSVLIGFVLSMVFGHALIILPAVARIRLVYSAWLYGPLALLHLSLVLRAAGGLMGAPDLRAWSGVITVVALVSFAGVAAYGVLRRA